MRKLFFFISTVIAAVTAFGAYQKENPDTHFPDWVYQYQPLFGADFDTTDVKWVAQTIDTSAEEILSDSDRVAIMDEYFPEWREGLIRDTCTYTLGDEHKRFGSVLMRQMKEHSSKRNTVSTFWVADGWGPIWQIKDGVTLLRAHMSLKEGETFRKYGPPFDAADWYMPSYNVEYIVHKIDSIEVRGARYKRLAIAVKSDPQRRIVNRWVPTIGWQNDTPWNNMEIVQRFISKYVKGKLVFTYEDFEVPAIGEAGIPQVPTVDISEIYRTDKRKYDLMGREIKEPAPGTVYIQGGRKLIAR